MKCPYCKGRNHRAISTKRVKWFKGTTQYRECRDCRRRFAVDRKVRALGR